MGRAAKDLIYKVGKGIASIVPGSKVTFTRNPKLTKRAERLKKLKEKMKHGFRP